MPVMQVKDSPKVEPNRVYIIPPNKHLEISVRANCNSPSASSAARTQ